MTKLAEEGTVSSLLGLFAEHPALTENLAQFGPLQITREENSVSGPSGREF